MPNTCVATFEPVPPTFAERRGTHTCIRGEGHLGPHFCPTCRTEWASADQPEGDS